MRTSADIEAIVALRQKAGRESAVRPAKHPAWMYSLSNGQLLESCFSDELNAASSCQRLRSQRRSTWQPDRFCLGSRNSCRHGGVCDATGAISGYRHPIGLAMGEFLMEKQG